MHDDLLTNPWEHVDDDYTLRLAMIDVARSARERERLRELLQRVVADYMAAMRKHADHEEQLRDQIQAYLLHTGQTTVHIPDVGKAQVRRTAAKVVVDDPDAAKREYGDRFVKPVFDETAFKQFAKDRWLTDGELVAGITPVPAGHTVALTFG